MCEVFLAFKAGILNIPGIKLKIKGIKKEVVKLINESLIRWFWVFIYMPQKQII